MCPVRNCLCTLLATTALCAVPVCVQTPAPLSSSALSGHLLPLVMANIPMAYDVLPTGTTAPASAARQGGRAYAPSGSDAYAHSVIGSQEDAHQSLLLNEQQQEWQQELAVEGAGYIPVERFRHTPKQAVLSAYGIINLIICALFNLGINVGLGYAILHNNDEVGLWKEPSSDEFDHPYASAAWSDLLITAFLITFFTTLISTPGIRKAILQGQAVPVEGKLLSGGCLRCLPVRMLGTCTRSLLLGLWATLVLGVGFVVLMQIVCSAGGMVGSGKECSMHVHSYIWLKGAYAAVVAALIYPLVLLSAANSRTMPQLDLTLALDNLKTRYEEEKRSKDPQPL